MCKREKLFNEKWDVLPTVFPLLSIQMFKSCLCREALNIQTPELPTRKSAVVSHRPAKHYRGWFYGLTSFNLRGTTQEKSEQWSWGGGWMMHKKVWISFSEFCFISWIYNTFKKYIAYITELDLFLHLQSFGNAWKSVSFMIWPGNERRCSISCSKFHLSEIFKDSNKESIKVTLQSS